MDTILSTTTQKHSNTTEALYKTAAGKDAIGIIGDVQIVDDSGTAIDFSSIGVDITGGAIDSSCYIGKSSTATSGDFVVTYTAATQVTFSGYPGAITAFTATDIEAIKHINSSGDVVATYHRDDVRMTLAGHVLTVTGAVFGATDTFVVYTNVPRPASGGAGGAGGGSIVYTNMSGDFTATPTNGAATITITGLPFTLEAKHVAAGSIKKIAVTTGTTTTLTPSTISVSGGVITLGGITNFATGDELAVTLIGPDKAYDTSLDSQLAIVQNPEYAHETSVETLVNESAWPGLIATVDNGSGDATHIVTTAATFTSALTASVLGYKVWNIDDATYGLVSTFDSTTSQHTTGGTVTNWNGHNFRMPVAKYYEINMETYKYLTVHYRLTADSNSAYTLKFYGTLDSTAVVDSDSNWVDLSSEVFSAAAIYADGITATATVATEGLITLDRPTPMLKYMVKIVAEGKVAAASGSSAIVYVKKA